MEQKKPIMTWETAIKLAVYIALGAFAYANIAAKIENHTDLLEQIQTDGKANQREYEMQRDAMRLQIQTCETQIAVINEQIKDMQNDK